MRPPRATAQMAVGSKPEAVTSAARASAQRPKSAHSMT